MNASKKPQTEKGLFEKEWHAFKGFMVPFLFDAAKGSLILAGLYFFRWVLHFGVSIGVDNASITVFERVHFWASFASYSMLSIGFIWKLGRAVFLKGEK